MKNVFTRSRIFLSILVASAAFSANAQSSIQNYQFTQTVSPYQEITGGTILGSIDIDEEVFNNSTTGVSGTVTDVGFPIGFSFVYNNQSYDRFAVGTNGYIKLGNGTFPITGSVAAAFTQTFGDTNGLKQIIAALHGDLEGQSGSTLRYQTIGTAPARELVVQWRKFMFWNTTGPDSLNFQIRLKEAGNAIEFCYGNIVRNATDKIVSVGMNGNTLSEAIMRRARVDSSETWQTSTASFSPNTKCDLRTAYVPQNGLKMLFYGLPPIPNDLAVLGIQFRKDLDFGCAGTNQETISLVVENRGTQEQTAVLASLWVNGVNLGSSAIGFTPSLQPSERRVVALSQTANMSLPGTFNLIAYTSLSNDTGQYSGNDTARISKQIFAPASIPASPINNLIGFGQKGWNFYNGFTKPIKSGSKFTQLNYFYSATSAVQINAFAGQTDTTKEWIVSPSYQPAVGQILKFRAAITAFDTTTNITSIDDDEIKVLITTDCGSTWQTLYTFNQASVTGGVLSKTKAGYSVPISSTAPFQVAFFVNNKATNPSNTYYFHLDDVTMSLGNAYDLTAKKVEVVGLGASGCSQSSFSVNVRVKNVGDSTVSSSQISLRVNANPALNQNFTFSPSLAPGDSTEITFSNVSIPPNNSYRIVATTRLSLEDGFSSINDTSSTVVYYLGSTTPLTLPATVDFNFLPSGVPEGWLCDVGAFTDFRVRVRGVSQTKSLSANLYSSNKSSFAIMPSTEPLPANYALKFDIKVSNDNGANYTFGSNDSITVWLSDNCGASFSQLLKINTSNPIGANTFSTAMVDLSAYQGKSVSIKFEVFMNRSDFTGAWVDIDNIGIAPNTAVDPTLVGQNFSVYPNPNEGKFQVKLPTGSGAVSYSIIDLSGKIIQSGMISPESDSQEINLSNYQSGFYFLKANIQGIDITRKIIIN